MKSQRRKLPQGETDELRLSKAGRFVFAMLLLALLLVLALVINVETGSVHIPSRELFPMLWKGMCLSIGNAFTGGALAEELEALVKASTASQILFSIRLPRIVLASVLGGALSVSGYLLQVFFRNPIAGPFVLGISSGAKMLVGITLIFVAPMWGGLGSFSLVFAAFLGSLAVTAVVLVFSQKLRDMSMLLVVGVMLGYICGAVTDLCICFADEYKVADLTGWAMGSFSAANWEEVKTGLLLCLPAVFAALLLSKPISAYTLGEDNARSMGIRVVPFRVLLLVLSSLLSACVTALAGPISFVGIAVPHISRWLLNSARPIYLIPASFLCGAVFTVFCDLIARTVLAPTELSIGTVTAVFGAPIVIYIMVKRRRIRED